MMVKRSHPRDWTERSGQVNWRDVDYGGNIEISPFPLEIERPSERGSRFADDPSCSVFVQKRKGFGSLGNIESQPTSLHGINRLKNLFPEDKFLRYQVNVYIKRK